MYPYFSLRAFVALAFLFVATSANAQITGYIVKSSGDTVRGTFPGYRPRAYNTKKVNFNDQSGAREYGVNELRGYAIDGGDEYIAFEGSRMTNALVIETGSGEQRTERYQTISTFLRLFAQAKGYRFYVYNDALRINFFYASATDTITELKHWVFIDNNNPENIETGLFRTQLTQLLGETPGRIAYEEDALRIWISSVSGVTTNRARRRKADEGWVVMAGVALNEFQTRGFVKEREYNGNQSAYLAAGYVVRVSHRFEQIFCFPQVSYHSYSATGQRTSSGETEIITSEGYGFGAGFYVGVRLISKPSLKVFVAPGMDALVFLDHKLSYKYEYQAGYLFAQRPPTQLELKSLAMSPRMLAGMEVKHFSAWGAYRLSTAVSESRLLGAQLSGFQAGLGYRF